MAIFVQVERDKKLLQKKLADADAAKKGADDSNMWIWVYSQGFDGLEMVICSSLASPSWTADVTCHG